jgi:hypothetical protein
MKKVFESARSDQNEKDLFSIFTENEILDLQSMSHVRGGDNDGGEPVIIIPPPPE